MHMNKEMITDVKYMFNQFIKNFVFASCILQYVYTFMIGVMFDICEIACKHLLHYVNSFIAFLKRVLNLFVPSNSELYKRSMTMIRISLVRIRRENSNPSEIQYDIPNQDTWLNHM